MKELFLAFVPRFINDQIALTDNGEQYEIACSMVDVNLANGMTRCVT